MSAALLLALYEPDIPQNVGAAVRTAAALGCPLHLVEPLGFVFAAHKLGRTALDYHARATIVRHASWRAFETFRRGEGRRLVLLTTAATEPYTAVAYRPGDMLLCGRESSGAPPEVHAAADLRVVIPLAPAVRSLNVAVALAMVAGEALRQLGAAPSLRQGGTAGE